MTAETFACLAYHVQDNSKARTLLLNMASDAVRAAVLEQLESLDAARAAVCRGLLAVAPSVAAAADDHAVPAPAGVAAEAEGAAGTQQQHQQRS